MKTLLSEKNVIIFLLAITIGVFCSSLIVENTGIAKGETDFLWQFIIFGFVPAATIFSIQFDGLTNPQKERIFAAGSLSLISSPLMLSASGLFILSMKNSFFPLALYIAAQYMLFFGLISLFIGIGIITVELIHINYLRVKK